MCVRHKILYNHEILFFNAISAPDSIIQNCCIHHIIIYILFLSLNRIRTLKFAFYIVHLKILNSKNGFYGQEINPTSYNLCRINMILHNVGYENFDISLGDTLLEPKHEDNEPFDAIVSNPPYSIKWAVILIHFL